MQQSPQPIFELTSFERAKFASPATSKAPASYRFRTAIQPIITKLYSFVPELNLGAPQPMTRVYDNSFTTPEFNKWVDKQWQKRLDEIKAKREATVEVQDEVSDG